MTALTDLPALANLKGLYVGGNNLSSIEGVSVLNSLQTISVSVGKVSDLSPLANLSGLKNISITGSKVSDLTPLKNLHNLTSLSLANNSISDISALSEFTAFDNLVLIGNHIFDFSPILNATIAPSVQSIGYNLSTEHQTIDADISGKTYTLPALFQQVRLGDNNDGKVSSLLNNNWPFVLENATLSEDEKTLTVTDINQPAKITIASTANGLTSLAASNPQNAAAGSTITIYASEEAKAAVKAPDTGLFTSETASAILRNLGIGLAAIAIITAPIALTIKRIHSRPRLGRNRKK